MKKIYNLLVCLLVSQIMSAQAVDPKLADAFQNTIDSMLQVLNIYGLGAAVQLPNDAVWAGGSGISTFTPVDSIGPDHKFETGSSTKTITAACILQLVDEGILSLDDSLFSWVPAFDYIDPNITIRQLLRHQSGIYDVLQNPSFNTIMSQNINQIWMLEDVISSFIQPPDFQPGTSWAYSNTNYMLLGLIIEMATNKPYNEEINDRFFTPMGLNSYSNPAFDPLLSPAAHLWLDITGDQILDDAFTFLISRKSMFSAIGPAGGYFAKPADLAKWIRASMSGSLFTPGTWTEATETVTSSLPGNTKYGLGLTTRDYIGFAGYGHGGDLGGYTTQAFYFPEKDISIVVCGNDASINSWQLTNTVSAILQVYIDCEAIISNTQEPEHIKASVSVYPNPFFQRTTVVVDSQSKINEMYFTLTDLLGNLVWSSDPHSAISANGLVFNMEVFSPLKSGIYFLNTYVEGQFVESVKVFKTGSD